MLYNNQLGPSLPKRVRECCLREHEHRPIRKISLKGPQPRRVMSVGDHDSEKG